MTYEVDVTFDFTVNDFENEIRKFLLSMYSNSTIPHVVVTEVVKLFETFVNLLKTKVTSIIYNTNDEFDNQCLRASDVETVFNKAEIALQNVNSPFKAKNSLFRHPLYVAPEKICFSFEGKPIWQTATRS